MKAWETWLFHGSTVLVTVSGLVYLWMKYGMVTDDPFSVVNHPWQPTMLDVHLLAAPLLVFVVGVMTHSHILKKWRSDDRRNRASGLTAALVFPVMILSGYGLQVLTHPVLTRAALILHLASSSVFVMSYLTHQVISLRLGSRANARKDATYLIRGRA